MPPIDDYPETEPFPTCRALVRVHPAIDWDDSGDRWGLDGDRTALNVAIDVARKLARAGTIMFDIRVCDPVTDFTYARLEWIAPGKFEVWVPNYNAECL